MTTLSLTINSPTTLVITGENLTVAVGERDITHSPANVLPPADKAVADKPQTPSRSATAIHCPDHATPTGDDGHPSEPSIEATGAKSDGLQSVAGQVGGKPRHYNGHSMQEPADNPQGGNEAASGKSASVTNSNPWAKLRPLCQSPDDCAGYGSHTCHRCLKAAETVEVAA